MDQPTASDVSFAEYIIRTHCPIDWPEGRLCLNCRNSFPCDSNRWAQEILTAAGPTEEEIVQLDVRTGPWS